MATKTEVKPATEVVIEASTKVVALITTMVAAQASYVSKKRVLAEGIRAEADRQGFDKKQANQMALASWLVAFKLQNADEATKKAFSDKSRPDIAKIMSLAYPANAKATKEVQKAYKLNDTLKDAPKQERIGENNLLRIARGEVTVEEIVNKKAADKANKNKATSSALDSTVTPQERWQNSVTGILKAHHVGDKNKLTRDQAMEGVNAAFEAFFKSAK